MRDHNTTVLGAAVIAAFLLAASCDSLSMKTDLMKETEVQTKALSWHQVSTGIQVANYWRGVSASADGSAAVLGMDNTGFFRLKDAGLTWLNAGGSGYTFTGGTLAASSDTGIVTIAAMGTLYRSEDGGGSFGSGYGDVHGANWIDVAMSDSGQVVAAVCGYNQLHYSVNGGVGWTVWATPTGTSPRVGISGDGSTVAFTNSSNEIIVSHDGGSTFSAPMAMPGTSKVNDFALSRDGSTIVAVTGDPDYNSNIANAGYVIISVDGGLTWTQAISAGQRIWTACACSANGRVIAASAVGASGAPGYIHRSKNQGLTWSMEGDAGLHDWMYLGCSDDGLFCVALATDSVDYFVGN